MALSADRPEKLRETVDKHQLTWTLLSDASGAAALALGLAFHVDDETLKRYKGFGIDLEDASGQKHHQLPVPAVFLINEGKVEFSYVNPDYRVRIPAELVRDAARTLPH